MDKLINSIASIERNELGQLKGGFTVYKALPIMPIQKSVSVTVSGHCGCSCNATSSSKML